MIVMGGIIGSGIFMNPAVVARQVHTPFLILGAWVIGGLFALAAAFIWAELAAARPEVGGQYAYLREAFHPAVAFLYGWVLLLVIQTGGMAAVAVTFARYFVELTNLPIGYAKLAALVLAVLTVINCLGVRAGSTVQSILMVLKIAALLALVIFGLTLTKPAPNPSHLLDGPPSFGLLTAFGAALVPVIFSYGGWQTATFVAGEIKEPRRGAALPRGERCLHHRVGFGGPGRVSGARVGRDAQCTRRFWRARHRGRHRDLDGGFSEPKHVDGAARLFRDGPGRTVFQERRQSSSANTRTDRGDRATRFAGDRDRVSRQLRSNSQLRCFH
jgi:hypothetical protein